MSTPTRTTDDIHEAVRQRYAEAAKDASAGAASCCGPAESSCGCGTDALTENEVRGLRRRALLGRGARLAARRGEACLARLREPHDRGRAPSRARSFLDLGSGGGIDVLLSAQRVGPRGKAYGLDMTDEMLELARRNQREAGVENAEFLKGTIEEIPLPDDSVDVIISNCVINLSADKPRVFREAARVLRPGGRFAVTDVVADPDMDEATRRDMRQWTGCIAGALTEEDFSRQLARRRVRPGSRSAKPTAYTSTPVRRSSERSSRLTRAFLADTLGRAPPQPAGSRNSVSRRFSVSPSIVATTSTWPSSGVPRSFVASRSSTWKMPAELFILISTLTAELLAGVDRDLVDRRRRQRVDAHPSRLDRHPGTPLGHVERIRDPHHTGLERVRLAAAPVADDRVQGL